MGVNEYRLTYKTCELKAQSEIIYWNLYGNKGSSFWLDSSKIINGYSRFSIMGSAEHDDDKIITYKANSDKVNITQRETKTIVNNNILDYLDEELRSNVLLNQNEGLPFGFLGGFIGFLGYELKSELNCHTTHESIIPDAAFLFITRYLVFDHLENQIYLVALQKEGEENDVLQWQNEILHTLEHLQEIPSFDVSYANKNLNFSISQDFSKYNESINSCLNEIRNGESYELCLTNQVSIDLDLDPMHLYLTLRKVNPAPYAGFLRFDDFSILSSSPEQFLKLFNNRAITTKPIKGTILKSNDYVQDLINIMHLQNNQKDRAENLMIVDLLRNDLGRVCEVGSVCVPKLMDVESYETLHQLVSTVKGKVKQNFNIIDVIKATFPGGSITGAPKVRTMEIIDELESVPREAYTGSLGYLSLNGESELNILIRTAIINNNRITVGAGGAITSLSDPTGEYNEVLLKAYPLIKAIVLAATGDFNDQSYTIN